jgi:hypothetical protein
MENLFLLLRKHRYELQKTKGAEHRKVKSKTEEVIGNL